MTAYFNQTGWPAKAPKTEEERKEFIASLHKRKTELFMALIEKKLLPLRPGVQRSIFPTICWPYFNYSLNELVSCDIRKYFFLLDTSDLKSCHTT